MIAAVSITVWAIFGAVLILSLGLVAKMLIDLLRRLKTLRASTARAGEQLNASMSHVNDLLQEVNDGLARLQSRKLRDR